MEEFRDWLWQFKHSLKYISHLELKNSITTTDTLITPYLVSLLGSEAIFKQFIEQHLNDDGLEDPLFEKKFMVAKGVIHRYPDRVLLVLTNKCFANCRFCFRKSNWKYFEGFSLKEACNYLRKNPQVREVILSGGDPLVLDDESLEKILEAIKSISSIKVIRIGTRALSILPYRITYELVNRLKNFRPIWFAIHVNHKDEITADFIEAAKKLLYAGFSVVSQTVLLRGINNSALELENLFCKLVEVGIKPYYLFGCDRAKGNEVFRVKIEEALTIINQLRNNISGLCMPNFAFDVDDGGKVVLEPQRIIGSDGRSYKIKNFEGREYTYEDTQY